MKVHTVFSVYQCVRVAGMVGVFNFFFTELAYFANDVISGNLRQSE